MEQITKPRPFCFVLMPFDESFNDIYQLGIKDACDVAGAYCERVDEQIYEERILDRIYNQISKADVIIADMTGRNPNVFYEVGYAHALGKRTVLLTQSSDDIPFDLKHFPHIIYNKKIVSLKEELSKRVQYYVENPIGKHQEKLAIEVYESNVSLASTTVEKTTYYDHRNNASATLKLLVHNNSILTLKDSDFQIGIIGSTQLRSVFDSLQRKRYTGFISPDNYRVIMLPCFDDLFPTAFVALELALTFVEPADFENIVIRSFSNLGIRDFPLNFRVLKKE